MDYFRAANRFQTTLIDDVDSSQTVIEVDSISGAPPTPFKLSIRSEIVNVVDVTGTLLTVERGAEGTTRAAHPEGTVAQNRWTAETYDKLCDNIDLVKDGVENHKQSDAPHTYGSRFSWEYNPVTDSLDLVVTSDE